MLIKMVDGKKVVMSDEEEAAMLAEWQANDEKVKEPKPKDRLDIIEDRLAALEAIVKP